MVKILEINNLSYKDFNNLNLSFKDRTFYSIIGPNNCGKTTLFKLIAGFIPTNDTISCDGVDLNGHSIREYIVNLGVVERVNKTSFIFKTVVDEMMYPLTNLEYSKKECLSRINDVLELFKEKSILDKKISQLDYYDKQLLLIMIAILHKPKVLLIDNVLETFPSIYKKKIYKVLKELLSSMTIINFTSSLNDINYSDRIILMNDKKIVGEYYPSDIYKDDQLFYNNNLKIPFLTDLSVKLRMYNLIDKEYVDMKEMVDDLWP